MTILTRFDRGDSVVDDCGSRFVVDQIRIEVLGEFVHIHYRSTHRSGSHWYGKWVREQLLHKEGPYDHKNIR